MRHMFMRAVFVAAVLALSAIVFTQSAPADGVSVRAKQLHDRAIVIDSHDDTTQRLLFDKTFDISVRQKNGNVDIPRMREGWLDGLFFSIWVPADVTGMPAVKTADALIDSVHKAVKAHPNDLMLATTAADVRRAASAHKIAALMGMEGGHMINDDLGQLRKYAAAGVRYLTLTHFKNNNWADSSTDKPAHNGLTPFGKDVVRELNTLGMMVDISHVADKAFSAIRSGFRVQRSGSVLARGSGVRGSRFGVLRFRVLGRGVRRGGGFAGLQILMQLGGCTECAICEVPQLGMFVGGQIL